MTIPIESGLITPEYLQTTLEDQSVFDDNLATWAIDVVSNTARIIANHPEWDSSNIPPVVRSIVSLAARRLYTNPDRFTRESSGDYSYGLDSSVTNADVFTPTEKGTLRSFVPNQNFGGLKVVSTTREGIPMAPDGYVPDGTEYGFPWY